MPSLSTFGIIDVLSLRGHNTDAQYFALAEYGAGVQPPACIVEIGTFRGKSACALASETVAEVFTIDPHDLPGVRRPTGLTNSGRAYNDGAIRREAAANTSAFPNVTMIRGFSEPVGRSWDGPPVGLLYIDGDHREGAVRRDYSAWEPHLTPDALVIWDDHHDNFPGVLITAARHINAGRLAVIEQVDGMLVTRRTRGTL